MSRLDSFINRLTAQRDLLNHIARKSLLPPEGTILELGLGNGRTFNHLREVFSDRRIIVFDRAVAAHKSSIPAEEDIVLGEISVTAAQFAGQNAAMVHADIGTGYEDADAQTLTWLPKLTVSLLAPGGIAASGLPLSHPELESLPLPPGIATDRYFLYRRKG
ncbi:MAG: class I SAM-dependent methyltransferase [Boseongicola sp.]